MHGGTLHNMLCRHLHSMCFKASPPQLTQNSSQGAACTLVHPKRLVAQGGEERGRQQAPNAKRPTRA